MGNQLTEAPVIRTFMTAGDATFTLVSTKTSNRFTYKVEAPSEDNGTIRFVKVLNGPDNTRDYAYIGTIRPVMGNWDGACFQHGGMKAKASIEAPSVVAFNWFTQALRADKITQIEFWHEGKCGKCGRKLTDPVSISLGMGPTCRGNV